MIDNTVVVGLFRDYTVYLHTAAMVVWNHSCVTEMAPGQNATRVKPVFSTLQNPAPCYARVKIPLAANHSAALALAGYQA